MDTEKRNLLIHTAETLIKTHDADLRETLVELALRVERETLEEAAAWTDKSYGPGSFISKNLRRRAGEVK